MIILNRFYIASNNGLIDPSNKSIYYGGFNIYDVYLGREVYLCTTKGLYKAKDNSLERICSGSCWRISKIDDMLIASLEGPILYDVYRDEIICDLRRYAGEYGWWFPHGDAHITDIKSFNGRYVASVEVGNLLVGKSLEGLKPIKFSEDMHNLLTYNNKLYIATASGVYYTEDLERFRLMEGSRGYFHALDIWRDALVGHVISDTPLRISEDGERWWTVQVKLPKPTFGTTGLAVINDILIYSTTSTYIFKELENAEIIIGSHPMCRRIVLK